MLPRRAEDGGEYTAEDYMEMFDWAEQVRAEAERLEDVLKGGTKLLVYSHLREQQYHEIGVIQFVASPS